MSDANENELIAYLESWEPDARVLGNVRAGDALSVITRLRAENEALQERFVQMDKMFKASRAEVAEIEQARRTGAYWKDELIAANKEIERLKADLAAERAKVVAEIRANALDMGDTYEITDRQLDEIERGQP